MAGADPVEMCVFNVVHQFYSIAPSRERKERFDVAGVLTTKLIVRKISEY